MRRTDNAVFNTQAMLAVDARVIEGLKTAAATASTRRYRLCLHHSPEDPVQEMIVVHCRDNYSRPHAHAVPMTYLVLEGELRVFLFDDLGVVTQSVGLGAFGSGKPFALHLDPGAWYMPVCITPQVVFYESKRGPFDREATNRWAPWSPAEHDVGAIAAYRQRLGIVV